jgi:hypothetical protein
VINVTIERKHVYLLAVIVVLAALLVPVGAWASNQFTDVPDSDWAHDDISWLADVGVTLGCGGGEFCPDDPVTRRQMAAFMHRLAEAITPTVFAKTGTPNGYPSSGNCATAEFTPNAPQLASFNGAFYAYNDGGGIGNLRAKVEYKVNGGDWTLVPSQYWIYGGATVTGETSNSPLSGMMHLVAGNTYQFAVSVQGSNLGGGGCELNVISRLALPSDTVNSSSVSVSGGTPGDDNG